jgi:ParB family transcriptional regulator, chromosome partitioning protein
MAGFRRDEGPQRQVTAGQLEEIDVPIDAIDRDQANRRVVEDESFAQLVDSVRVLGVLDRLKLVARADGRYRLFDGERRWTAAQRAGLAMVPARVWPVGTDAKWAIEVGLALHETRAQPGSLDVARRLRQLKNQYGETADGIAARTGIAAKRVSAYLALFESSDFLLEFFEESEVPLYQAVEFVRFERVAGEAAARGLARRYAERPLSVRDIVAERKRKGAATGRAGEEAGSKAGGGRDIAARVEAALSRDEAGVVAQLETVLARHGFRLVKAG